MTENEKLRQWLNENNKKIVDLADAIGWSYNYVANMVSGNKPLTDGFRWRFGEVYGFEAAQAVFNTENVA